MGIRNIIREMQILILLLLLISCSSDKKLRGNYMQLPDNDERISHDWSGDGIPETILISPLSGPGEYRELMVMRGVLEGMPKEKMISNRSLVSRRARPGPTLRLQKNKTFHLIVDSSEVGRTSEVLTWKFTWRKGKFFLTGFVRDWTDKLDPNDHRTCDIDLPNGRGKKNGRPVKFEPLRVDLLDINERFLPSICEF